MDEVKYKLDAWSPSESSMLRPIAKMIRLQAVEIQDQAQKQIKLATDLIREANDLANLAANLDLRELSDFKLDQQIKGGPETESGETRDQGKQVAGEDFLAEDVSDSTKTENIEQKGKTDVDGKQAEKTEA